MPKDRTMGKKIAKSTTSIVPENAEPRDVTRTVYDLLQVAFEFFNTRLFDDMLPNVAIVLECRAHSAGSFAPNRFTYRVGDGGREHKLNLNPDSFAGKSDESVCQTLLHEMCHLWQHIYGRQPPRKKYNYHDREFAMAMEVRGLMTSSTGMPGGKRTGIKMSDYIIPGGAFAQAFKELQASGWKLPLESAIRPGAIKAPPSKVKFVCPQCASNMWGKPDSLDICGACNVWRKPEIADPADVASYDQGLPEAAE
jgi:hypothetical protein